nr:MAG TPA: hypothetical protein [Caudoviricetes sp.]
MRRQHYPWRSLLMICRSLQLTIHSYYYLLNYDKNQHLL